MNPLSAFLPLVLAGCAGVKAGISSGLAAAGTGQLPNMIPPPDAVGWSIWDYAGWGLASIAVPAACIFLKRKNFPLEVEPALQAPDVRL